MRAEIEPRGPVDPLERVLRDALLEQPLPPLLLIPSRAERADVERVRRQHADQRGQVELLVVGQHDHRRCVIGLNALEDLLGPGHDQFVGAREALRRRKAPARVRRDRAPAEPLRRSAQRLGRIDRAEYEEPRRRTEHVREYTPPLELDHLRVTAAQQLVRDRVVALEGETLRARLEVGDHDGAPVAERLDPCRELAVLFLYEHVDLAAAGQADPERLLVRDAERQ